MERNLQICGVLQHAAKKWLDQRKNKRGDQNIQKRQMRMTIWRTKAFWDPAKAVIRGKFISLLSQETREIPSNNLTWYLKELQREQKQPKICRRREIIKIRAELNEIEKKMTTEINTTKIWFVVVIRKIDKPLATHTEEKGGKSHVNNTRNEGEVVTSITGIWKITLEYYEKLYATKFNHLEETDKFL